MLAAGIATAAALTWALALHVIGRKSARVICPKCRANVEKDFMAPATVGRPEECNACAGEASAYPWFTKHREPSGLITSGIKRSCGRCGRVKYQAFLEKTTLTQPEIGIFEAWVCRSRDAKSCARRARAANLPLEQRPWYWRWLKLRRDVREYWLDMTFRGSGKATITMEIPCPCAEPHCIEDATGKGADGKSYCIGHINKGGPSKDVIIT